MNSGAFTEKWNKLFAKKNTEVLPGADMPQPAAEEFPEEELTKGQKVKRVLNIIWKVLFALRKVVLAVPVVWAALKLAAYNTENLPEMVGINLQSTGEFAQTIARSTAVNVPMMITFACLGLMVFSRKTVYPWLISVFTLILPILIFLTNSLG